jgi:energy-coupling factor transporter ATP-binding protein EcfA2
MKSRLHRIEIRNFKAFREFTLDLEGRHLLVYGGNGAGKSSLYWALYTFLQSTRKTTPDVSRYFQPGGKESLLNIYEQAEPTPKLGEIALTMRDMATLSNTTYQLSLANHGTLKQPLIEKGDLASDFVTYRFFFGFSHFRSSDTFDLWPLFEKEILPFCRITSGKIPFVLWDRIRLGDANPDRARGLGGTYAYQDFKQRAGDFATMLETLVGEINVAAQNFYEKHFASDDQTKVELKLGLTVRPDYNIPGREFIKPQIGFAIKVGTEVITRPQIFLNEAKLTQLALSVRFGAALVKLHESDLKLLVLDDLLVSLDMSNRMKVVEILLSETFANYQKIILTHDLGFFQEFKRTIGSRHETWLFQKLTGNAKDGPKTNDVKSPLEMAQHFLANDQIAECGNQLRKCVEANLTSFLEQAKQKKGLDHLIDRDSFASLHQKLNEASSELSLGGYKEFAELLQAEFTLDQLRALASPDEVDPNKFAAATKEEKKAKGALIAKLYAARPNLHQSILDLLSDASRKRLAALKLVEEVKRIKDRILNPASHAGASPLFTKEAEDAIKVIQALEPALNAALATL